MAFAVQKRNARKTKYLEPDELTLKRLMEMKLLLSPLNMIAIYCATGVVQAVLHMVVCLIPTITRVSIPLQIIKAKLGDVKSLFQDHTS